MGSKVMRLTIILFIYLSNNIYAAQEYQFKQYKKIDGYISAHEQNRILIEGDRVVEIIGLDNNRFLVNIDQRLGQIFIKYIDFGKNLNDPNYDINTVDNDDFISSPNNQLDNQKDTQNKEIQKEVKKFAIFSVITENGTVQDFRLELKDVDGQNIIVKDSSLSLSIKSQGNVNKNFGITHESHKEIIDIIKNNQDLFNVTNGKIIHLSKKLEMQLIARQEFSRYTLEIFMIKNKSSKDIILREEDFNIEGVSALMFQNRILKKRGTTKLYRIMNK